MLSLMQAVEDITSDDKISEKGAADSTEEKKPEMTIEEVQAKLQSIGFMT